MEAKEKMIDGKKWVLDDGMWVPADMPKFEHKIYGHGCEKSNFDFLKEHFV